MSMNNKEILEKIGNLKGRVKEIVQEIQNLKKQLETAQIPLKDFKERKSVLENELRGILQQITKTKETHQIAPTIRGKTLPKDGDTPESMMIDKEVLIAKEAEELMYYFSTEFEGSLTHANIYLAITVEANFVIGIEFENYPEKPKLSIPIRILELFNLDDELFFQKIPSFINWDSDNPKRIFELITEIETVLINMYSADLDSITKKSIEYSEKMKKLTQLVNDANNMLTYKEYDKAIEITHSVIQLAKDMDNNDLVQKYTKTLNEIVRVRDESKGGFSYY